MANFNAEGFQIGSTVDRGPVPLAFRSESAIHPTLEQVARRSPSLPKVELVRSSMPGREPSGYSTFTPAVSKPWLTEDPRKMSIAENVVSSWEKDTSIGKLLNLFVECAGVTAALYMFGLALVAVPGGITQTIRGVAKWDTFDMKEGLQATFSPILAPVASVAALAGALGVTAIKAAILPFYLASKLAVNVSRNSNSFA